jgi:hypothetical protein
MEAQVPWQLTAESDFFIESHLPKQLWRDSVELDINTTQ